MVDKTRLVTAMERKGYNYKTLAEAVGISEMSVRRKFNNETEFTASEIKKLCELLKLRSNRIFFL